MPEIKSLKPVKTRNKPTENRNIITEAEKGKKKGVYKKN